MKRFLLFCSGSAAANAISQYLLAVVLFVYICLRGLHKPTWGGQFFNFKCHHLEENILFNVEICVQSVSYLHQTNSEFLKVSQSFPSSLNFSFFKFWSSGFWPPAWSLDCLQEWGPFVHLAIPSMLMLCLEWWMFEIGGFLAGVISEVELGAHAIIYELAVVAYMVPLPLLQRSQTSDVFVDLQHMVIIFLF